MSQKVTKAVIPAGGFGTRFLPSSKSIPKEMFPVGNLPIIYHVVKECVDAGIKDIIIIGSHHKHAVENFFSFSPMLEEYYIKIGKKEEVKRLREIADMANFIFVNTEPPYGNGGCLNAIRHLVKDEPFLVAWGDEMFLTTSKKNRVKQCLETFARYNMPVISTIKIDNPKMRSRYGMVKLKKFNGEKSIKIIESISEKPKFGKEPSAYASHGAYILTNDFFSALDKTKPGANGELWISDVINKMKEKTGLLAKIIDGGIYLDCGVPSEYLYSQIVYRLLTEKNTKDVKNRIKKILKDY